MALDLRLASSMSEMVNPGLRLADVRRLCLRRGLRVSFHLQNGQECCINEHGATVIAGQAGSAEAAEEFSRADRFRLSGGGIRPREITRAALERLIGQVSGTRSLS